MQISSGYTQDPPCDDYANMLAAVRTHFDETVRGCGALFTTDAGNLFPAFLAALPEHERQHHTCNTCRHFFERYGSLVTITKSGDTVPVMWGDGVGIYQDAFKMLRKRVAKAAVNGVFMTSERTWGQSVAGGWQHMAVIPPSVLVFRPSALKNADQAAAEKREEYKMLQRGLGDFSLDIARQALNILESDTLFRNEKCLGPARWFCKVHEAYAGAKHAQARRNAIWLAVAEAPTGFCHVCSTMIGTLLEDLTAGLPLDSIKQRFNDKMDPLKYQRPQSAPSAGNIAQAEKVVAALESAGALKRRYAKLSDIKTFWTPKPLVSPEKPGNGSVFGHLTPKGKEAPPDYEIPATTVTWCKFCLSVLPEAEQIEALVPRHGSFLALLTAADPDAPPIVQWDLEEARNPVSWYVYPGGSTASQWNLPENRYVSVNALAFLPPMWNPDHRMSHQGEGVIFIIDGCRDTTPYGGSALFPELLKSEYHPVRKTIEAYSRSTPLLGEDEASACGIDLRKGERYKFRVRVTSKGGTKVALYDFDRWD
jgi:hypothetical protein